MADDIDPTDLLVETEQQAIFDEHTGLWSYEEELEDADEETCGAMDRF